MGPSPAGKVPRVTPSLVRIFETVPPQKKLQLFTTHILFPSKAIPRGMLPTGISGPASFVSYQRSIAICSGLNCGVVVPPAVAEIVSVLAEGVIVTLSPATNVIALDRPLTLFTT